MQPHESRNPSPGGGFQFSNENFEIEIFKLIVYCMYQASCIIFSLCSSYFFIVLNVVPNMQKAK